MNLAFARFCVGEQPYLHPTMADFLREPQCGVGFGPRRYARVPSLGSNSCYSINNLLPVSRGFGARFSSGWYRLKRPDVAVTAAKGDSNRQKRETNRFMSNLLFRTTNVDQSFLSARKIDKSVATAANAIIAFQVRTIKQDDRLLDIRAAAVKSPSPFGRGLGLRP